MLFSIPFLLVALEVAACGGPVRNSAADAPPAPVPPEFAGQVNPLGPNAAAAGGIIFKANCEACHGPLGRGDGPAASALDPHPSDLVELRTRVGDDYLNWRIRTGREGTSMLAWQGVLTDEQIWQVVAFLDTLK